MLNMLQYKPGFCSESVLGCLLLGMKSVEQGAMLLIHLNVTNTDRLFKSQLCSMVLKGFMLAF